jgi:hypothetical protein
LGEIWIQTHTDDEEWPVGYLFIKNKLYKGMELCITEIYALEIVRSYHFFNGHPGVDKLVKGLKLRYQFQTDTRSWIWRTGSKGVVSFVKPANTQIGQSKADMI